MPLRLYVDEDAMARALVQGLRARGVDVLTVLDAGLSEQDDRAQLAYAAAHGRALYTFNVAHFYRLHAEWLAQGQPHAGIIVVHRQRYTVGEQIRRLLRLINTHSAEAMQNVLHFL